MSMGCIYCGQSVINQSPMTIPGKGVAHLRCFQTDQALKRTFQTLDISKLNDAELADLKEIVIAEENARNKDNYDIELF
ncbi:DUF2175 family protein [Bermanella sp. WJH001]|uniref:DUF2175 family protein n=1 Tax=Bermanella sp. WJH001 TaxID=3048005 RepID=UPI0024BE832B|nr:DUF2175 family protein [Bermanella sp. WJH001]MDJ1538754.1 DUF2175 family protein [Bermanella sp. WJH001]